VIVIKHERDYAQDSRERGERKHAEKINLYLITVYTAQILRFRHCKAFHNRMYLFDYTAKI
jgi:hypothetical protein